MIKGMTKRSDVGKINVRALRCNLHRGDCISVLRMLIARGVKVDSIVSDPPYHLTSIVRRFGSKGSAPAKHGKDGSFSRLSTGFLGKEWDGGDIAFKPLVWKLVRKLLKPGGFLLAFAATRNYHRMACAIEDAGFEIRDQMAWMYGTGFPKSLDIGRGVDKLARGRPQGAPDPDSPNHGKYAKPGTAKSAGAAGYMREKGVKVEVKANKFVKHARKWIGWGTALKPAWEPIVMARKPLSLKHPTIVKNVLRYGTGGINIDASRIPLQEDGEDPRMGGKGSWKTDKAGSGVANISTKGERIGSSKTGRFPANILHDNSNMVRERLGDASRFFYSAKANKQDRVGSKHPTVKPVKLMEYLVRMVTPKGGVVLDPFAGTGTTGAGAFRVGVGCILIEREPEYFQDILRRMKGEGARLKKVR